MARLDLGELVEPACVEPCHPHSNPAEIGERVCLTRALA